MRAPVTKFLIVVAVVAALATPGLLNAGEQTVLRSEDGLVQLQLPAGWEGDEDESPDAGIEAQHHGGGMWAMVILEPKADFDDLEAYARLVRKMYARRLKDAEASEAKRVTVGGHPAIRFDVKGGTEGVKLAFVITVVETETMFNQVVAWCGQSSFEKNRDELAAVADGLNEVAASGKKAEK